jgi:hypothetical protein
VFNPETRPTRTEARARKPRGNLYDNNDNNQNDNANNKDNDKDEYNALFMDIKVNELYVVVRYF